MTREHGHHDDALPIDPDLAPDDPGEPSVTHHPTTHVHRSHQSGVLTAIAAGGFLGTTARYAAGLAWPWHPGRVPWTTLAINVSGAFLLGVTLTTLLERMRPTRYARPFLCVGVLGSWTTMSTFAFETDVLLRTGRVSVALAYIALTIVAGTAAAWCGIIVARPR